ncbi:MAG: photosystem II protein Y [Cyanobacteria bacterium P01_F01_bin.53]
MSEISNFVDLRVLCVLSPITTAVAWAMLIYNEPSLKDNPWRF